MNTEIERINKALIKTLNLIENMITGGMHPSTNDYKLDSIKNIRESLNQPTQPEGYQGLNNGTFAEVVKEEKGFDMAKQIPVIMTANKMFGGVKEEKEDELKNRETLKISDEGKEKIMQYIKEMNEQPVAFINSSDKELLKECLDVLERIDVMVLTELISFDVQTLLTKLNKHLNHE